MAKTKIIDGFVTLVDFNGVEMVPPEQAQVQWTTEDSGAWQVNFKSYHHFRGPFETLTWIRFTDESSRVLFDSPQDPLPGDLIIQANA